MALKQFRVLRPLPAACDSVSVAVAVSDCILLHLLHIVLKDDSGVCQPWPYFLFADRCGSQSPVCPALPRILDSHSFLMAGKQ